MIFFIKWSLSSIHGIGVVTVLLFVKSWLVGNEAVFVEVTHGSDTRIIGTSPSSEGVVQREVHFKYKLYFYIIDKTI